ncbi:hypothetical protein P3X46_023527 [Hevea brasiliensis]|uniref:Uncharacterized protein n=1 Tax=Hevea brasiliensis TaxID=3981 RepID=A0ABQ9LB88_HEVBR|nr:hypothetical protein P3X46_023527 [Hevea brasiliensis]
MEEEKESVKGKAEYIKESAKGKMGEYADKAKETKGLAKEKLGEYKDYAAEKAQETKESDKAGEYKYYAVEKAKETRDYTAEKDKEAAERAKETKDYTAKKAEEGKDSATSMLSELPESAKGAGRNSVDLFSKATKEKLSEAEEEVRRKMEELKVEAEREITARDTIFGNIGLESITDSIEGKLTQPRDDADATQNEHGGTGRRDADKLQEEVVLLLEETPTEAVAATQIAVDQMTSQTFNDVGRPDDEGYIRLKRTGL